MSENFNYTELSNKWFELANDAYRTYVKGFSNYPFRFVLWNTWLDE